MARFKVVEESQSGHCCFKASIVDTDKPCPHVDGGYLTIDGQVVYENLCEFFSKEDANWVCAYLNFAYDNMS